MDYHVTPFFTEASAAQQFMRVVALIAIKGHHHSASSSHRCDHSDRGRNSDSRNHHVVKQIKFKPTWLFSLIRQIENGYLCLSTDGINASSYPDGEFPHEMLWTLLHHICNLLFS